MQYLLKNHFVGYLFIFQPFLLHARLKCIFSSQWPSPVMLHSVLAAHSILHTVIPPNKVHALWSMYIWLRCCCWCMTELTSRFITFWILIINRLFNSYNPMEKTVPFLPLEQLFANEKFLGFNSYGIQVSYFWTILMIWGNIKVLVKSYPKFLHVLFAFSTSFHSIMSPILHFQKFSVFLHSIRITTFEQYSVFEIDGEWFS